ncbi:MAG TPA: TlpA disulfide reductase family protein [Candidatus Binatia bacterium]|nr:TlpA disulfide reductase family protein [Candidatus Binatia bacterium]
MSRYILWAIVALALGVGTVVVAPYFFSQRSGMAVGLVGRPAPVFPLRDDSGASVSLDQYRGRIVLMNLWASWCPPCRAEMPDLQRLANDYERDGLVVVGVNEGESADRARAFADSLRIRFPIWIDDGERYGRTYAAAGLPTTVLLDRSGAVALSFDGALTFEQMRTAVASVAKTH